tara:strand:+ start:554 stop:706 length:153 start_codon:yes stop_codon:yes gene_type:complete
MPASKWMIGLDTEFQLKNFKQLKAGYSTWITKQPSKAKITSPKIHVASQA